MVDDCRPRGHYCGAVDRAGQRGERGYAKKKVVAAKGVAVLGSVTVATGAERVMRSVRSAPRFTERAASGGGNERHSGHPRGETSYTYDKVGWVTETATRRSLLKPLLKRFSYAGYSDQVTPNTGHGKGAIHIPNKSLPAG